MINSSFSPSSSGGQATRIHLTQTEKLKPWNSISSNTLAPSKVLFVWRSEILTGRGPNFKSKKTNGPSQWMAFTWWNFFRSSFVTPLQLSISLSLSTLSFFSVAKNFSLCQFFDDGGDGSFIESIVCRGGPRKGHYSASSQSFGDSIHAAGLKILAWTSRNYRKTRRQNDTISVSWPSQTHRARGESSVVARARKSISLFYLLEIYIVCWRTSEWEREREVITDYRLGKERMSCAGSVVLSCWPKLIGCQRWTIKAFEASCSLAHYWSFINIGEPTRASGRKNAARSKQNTKICWPRIATQKKASNCWVFFSLSRARSLSGGRSNIKTPAKGCSMGHSLISKSNTR